ncbi:MAG: thioredoxin-dependent thiol peroxidase [Anaerolineae bacterium]|nr:thioredoxin-dependent thiol peroxidase [Anaerolineae bacterium]
MPAIGQTAPDFELLNQDNQPVRLSDFRGKKVVLFAYPKAGTPGCTTQACGFREQFPKLTAANVVVLGISADTPKDQLKWKQEEKLPYDLLSDPDHAVLEAWGAWGEKNMYGKKYMGIIRSHWVIDEHGVIADEQIGISPEKSVEQAVAQAAG